MDLIRREWGYMLYTNLSVQSTLLEGFTANGSIGCVKLCQLKPNVVPAHACIAIVRTEAITTMTPTRVMHMDGALDLLLP